MENSSSKKKLNERRIASNKLKWNPSSIFGHHVDDWTIYLNGVLDSPKVAVDEIKRMTAKDLNWPNDHL